MKKFLLTACVLCLVSVATAQLRGFHRVGVGAEVALPAYNFSL